MSKMILNKTPVRTAKSFHINEIELDIDVFQNNKKQDINIISNEIDKLIIEKNDKSYIESRIGLKQASNNETKITVPKQTKIEKPVIISYLLDDKNNNIACNIIINYEEGAQADFVISFRCENKSIKGFNYLKQETIAAENSSGKIIISNLLNDKSQNFLAIENTIEENANINHIIAEIGGNKKISNYFSSLNGFKAENNIKTIYLGKNDDIIDINYLIEMKGKNTKSNIVVQGALDNEANKAFKGTIDFKEGCVGAKGIENENCVILSNSAKCKSLPMLLCHEENVEGEHGVASGKIDEDKLFYIMTKGISYNEARKLIVKANFNEILEDINDEITKNNILSCIDEILN